MAIRLKLKHSATANKAPLPSDLEAGELALNTNAASPAAYIKDSAGNIVKLAGAGAVGAADATTTTKGVVTLADTAAITAGTAGRVVDAAQLKANVPVKLWKKTGTTLETETAGDKVADATLTGTTCKAWVNFNSGTGAVAIRASYNVSSITDNATGIYTVNFAAALPDANYAAVAGGRRDNADPRNAITFGGMNNTYTASAVQVYCFSDAWTNHNFDTVNVAIFR